ncbi:unnamed protein product [Closterium sp. NIES-65]|nr:unnamed protein product [Closterium sp. NIES-65]
MLTIAVEGGASRGVFYEGGITGGGVEESALDNAPVMWGRCCRREDKNTRPASAPACLGDGPKKAELEAGWRHEAGRQHEEGPCLIRSLFILSDCTTFEAPKTCSHASSHAYSHLFIHPHTAPHGHSSFLVIPPLFSIPSCLIPSLFILSRSTNFEAPQKCSHASSHACLIPSLSILSRSANFEAPQKCSHASSHACLIPSLFILSDGTTTLYMLWPDFRSPIFFPPSPLPFPLFPFPFPPFPLFYAAFPLPYPPFSHPSPPLSFPFPYSPPLFPIPYPYPSLSSA